jgi:hypothetical protein
VPTERHRTRPDPDAGWERFPEVRVRFDAAVARWVRERQPYFFRREEEAAGGPVFVYAVRDQHDVLAWLLSWGGAFQVLGPPAFRRLVAEEARLVLARHHARLDLAGLADLPELGDSGAPESAPARTVSGVSL